MKHVQICGSDSEEKYPNSALVFYKLVQSSNMFVGDAFDSIRNEKFSTAWPNYIRYSTCGMCTVTIQSCPCELTVRQLIYCCCKQLSLQNQFPHWYTQQHYGGKFNFNYKAVQLSQV